MPSQSTHVQIDGEDARQFLAGLAENIGLDNTRAARMVSAGVAARTRFIFLQAWVIFHTFILTFASFCTYVFLAAWIISSTEGKEALATLC